MIVPRDRQDIKIESDFSIIDIRRKQVFSKETGPVIVIIHV